MRDLPAASLGLRRAKLLQGLETPALEQLARECTWRRFSAGQVLFSRDSRERDVYLIVAGKVRVTIYAAAGKRVTFRDLGEGDSVGELAAIDGSPRSADVVALTEVVAARVSDKQFRALLAREPLAAEEVLRNLARLVRLLSERVLELSTLGVQNRIHAELLRLAREGAGESAGPRCAMDPAPRHGEIASRVSTTREQVTRELSALARRGLVVKEGSALVVTDMAVLQRMVEEASL